MKTFALEALRAWIQQHGIDAVIRALGVEKRVIVKDWLRRERPSRMTDGWARYVLARMPEDVWALCEVRS